MCVTRTGLLLGCHPGNEVGLGPGFVPVHAKTLQVVSEGFQVILKLRFPPGPVPSVLFRPEEVHAASTKAAGLRSGVSGPAAELSVNVAHDRLRLGGEQLLIPHFHRNGFPTV